MIHSFSIIYESNIIGRPAWETSISLHILSQTSGGCTGPEQMMGESANSDTAIGNYYVETNADFPFAKGQTCTE